MEYNQFYYTVPKVLTGNQRVSLNGEGVKEVGHKDKMKDLVTYFMFLHMHYNIIIQYKPTKCTFCQSVF